MSGGGSRWRSSVSLAQGAKDFDFEAFLRCQHIILQHRVHHPRLDKIGGGHSRSSNGRFSRSTPTESQISILAHWRPTPDY